MYEAFFGLRRRPFHLAPDPHFFFLTPSNREALTGLTCAITSRAGLAVMSGDAGTGKTTLLRTLVASLPAGQVDFSFVLTPTLSPMEFLQVSMADFGLSPIPASKSERLALLQETLVQRRSQGSLAVLVVDEAHKLPLDVLEDLRLLTNFEDAGGKLLQILLSGQNELDDTLRRADLRQFKQRVAYRFAIQPLSAQEVGEYMQHRWLRAGNHLHHPFTDEAVGLVAQYSRGIPRVVNTICDNALLAAFASQVSRVGREQVREAVADLDLDSGSGEPYLKGLVSTRIASLDPELNGRRARLAESDEPGMPVTEPATPRPSWSLLNRFRPRKERFTRLGL